MEHRNNFDALRLTASLAVLLSHMAAIGGEPEWEPVPGYTWGRIGVLVFFSISGYLVMMSWRRDPELGRFLAKRFLRIVPGLAVVMPLSMIVVTALGLRGFFDNPLQKLNGSLWTIEYEAYCYLILAGLSLWGRHPAIALIAAYLIARGLYVSGPLVEFPPYFALGMALHEYPRLLRYWWVMALAGAAGLWLSDQFLPLLVVPLTIQFGRSCWPVVCSAGQRGDLSYGIYIYAFPIQQVVVAYTGADASYWTHLAWSLPIVLLFAWFSWSYVEPPALQRKPVRSPPLAHAPESVPH